MRRRRRWWVGPGMYRKLRDGSLDQIALVRRPIAVLLIFASSASSLGRLRAASLVGLLLVRVVGIWDMYAVCPSARVDIGLQSRK